jgi:deoxynucleoside triphosphate triphosphohydrolase SAMHD1
MSLVAAYKQHIDEFATACLEPYLESLRASTWEPPSIKEVNDCVWQTVVLQPFEVAVLDSPLLQRLRYVRQLGVAHWTYPGAAHTRFEHTVGALHQIHRLTEALRQQRMGEPGGTATLPDAKHINVLRLAAICHDVGHGAMSHVVENAFKRLGTIDDLLFELADDLHVEEAKLSEAAAYYLLGSKAFRELVELARARTQHDLPVDVVTPLRNAILGRVIHDRYPLLQELINGPFDADKLDYITRDARMAGVPVVTDIPRLVQKVRAVEIEKSKLPKTVSRRVGGHHASYILYGVALSGGRTLDELMFGRTLLFDKIYRHQKVRAAEAMVASIIERLVGIAREKAAILPLLFEDDHLLALTRDGLSERFGRKIEDAEWESLGAARDLANRMKRRCLFVRAFAFSQSMPLDPLRHDDGQRLGFERLLRDAAKPDVRRELVDGIAAELRKIRGAVEDAWPTSFVDLPAYVAVDAPDSFGHPKEISRAHLVTADGRVVPFHEDSAESPAWSAAYLLTRDIGYVFTPQELALPTFLAAEVVFRREFGIRTPASAQQYAKVSTTRLDALRRKLTDAGYYNDLPSDLRAEPGRLRMADIDARIASIVDRLGMYQGLAPPLGGHSRTVRVDASRIRTWLMQFREDQHVEKALVWLETLKVVSREDIHQALRSFIADHSAFTGAWVCPFGSPKDSSAIVTYYVNDLAAEFSLEAASLSDALTDAAKPILFVDDFISSGAQARTILGGWAGGEGTPLNEKHGKRLPDTAIAELKKREVGFLFVVGEQGGTGAFQTEATKLGLKATVYAHIEASSVPRAFPNPTDPMRDRAVEIGRQLLLSSREGKSKEWADDRALGYGNNGYLLVFPYNTPTQTLTLLWSHGEVDGWPWLPLLPRRPKT